jgi:hypothetical protein
LGIVVVGQGGVGVGTSSLAGAQWQGKGAWADKVWPMLAVRLHEVMCPPGWRLPASGKDKAVLVDQRDVNEGIRDFKKPARTER